MPKSSEVAHRWFTFAQMEVLYLSYDGLTDGLGRSQVLPYIFGLQQKGHSFTIISFEKPGHSVQEHRTIQELCSSHGVNWIPLHYTASPPIVSTIYDVWKLQKKVNRLLQEKSFDIIHCRSYITSLVGLKMKRKHGAKFIFDMRAFYADERVDGGLWNLKNPIFRSVYNFFKKKEKEFLSEADHTISLTAKGKDIIHSWTDVSLQPVPIEVIACCADLGHFHPSNIRPELRAELQKRLGINNDELVLTYLGSIGTWYMLGEMLDFFAALLRNRPTAKLLFITKDDAESILRPAREKGIPDSRIVISPAQRDEVPTYLSLADIAVFFIQPVFSKSGSSPTKHGEMLGMGLPVIANSGVGDVDAIIEDTDSGILVKEFTTEAYEKAVDQIDDLLKIPTETLQVAAQKYYSLEEGVRKYDTIYRSL